MNRIEKFPAWIYCSESRPKTAKAITEVLTSMPQEAFRRLSQIAFIFAPGEFDQQKEMPAIYPMSNAAKVFVFLPTQMDGTRRPYGLGLQGFLDDLVAIQFAHALGDDGLAKSWGFTLPGPRRERLTAL